MAGHPNKERDKRLIKRRLQGETYTEIAKAEGMSMNGAFLAVKRLQPEVLTALKRADIGLDKVVKKLAGFMEDDDHNIGLRATSQMLQVHGAINNETADSKAAATNIMVIVGATDERIEALKTGNAVQKHTQTLTRESTDSHLESDPKPGNVT